jgi:hypothetical protein
MRLLGGNGPRGIGVTGLSGRPVVPSADVIGNARAVRSILECQPAATATAAQSVKCQPAAPSDPFNGRLVARD